MVSEKFDFLEKYGFYCTKMDLETDKLNGFDYEYESWKWILIMNFESFEFLLDALDPLDAFF